MASVLTLFSAGANTRLALTFPDPVIALDPSNLTRPTVLHVATQIRRDDESNCLFELAKGLKDDGWSLEIACADCGIEREFAGANVTVHQLPLGSPNPLTIWLNSRRLTRLIADRRIQLVHGHDPSSAWAGALAAKRTGAAFMTTIHRYPAPPLGSIAKRFHSVMTGGDRVIATSDHLLDRLHVREPNETARFRLVRPGIDLSSFAPGAIRGHRLAALSERWQLSLDLKIVLAPGPIVDALGHIDLIKAMQHTKQRDWQLLLVGPMERGSSYLRSLEQAILAGGLTDRVVFGGECNDIAAAYLMSDLVVLPAKRDDGFAYFAVQAQAMGKPVLVSNCGALPEAVMPASTGWLIQPGDIVEMARSIDLAIELDPEVKTRLAIRARDFAADEFGTQQMVRRTAAVYRELVRNAPPPRLPKTSSLETLNT